MAAFLESPWPALCLGLLAEVLLGVAWHNTQDRRLAIAMACTLGLVGLLLSLEWLVVTPREAVSNTLEAMAQAVESNDLEEVMVFLAPEAARLRDDASRYLPRVTISEANIGGDLEVTINRFTNPPSARATFTGRISGVNHGPDRSTHEHFVRKFAIRLRQEGDGWLLTDYELRDPL